MGLTTRKVGLDVKRPKMLGEAAYLTKNVKKGSQGRKISPVKLLIACSALHKEKGITVRYSLGSACNFPSPSSNHKSQARKDLEASNCFRILAGTLRLIIPSVFQKVPRKTRKGGGRRKRGRKTSLYPEVQRDLS